MLTTMSRSGSLTGLYRVPYQKSRADTPHSWTASQLKAYLDYHGIPNPTPRTRDSLLHTVRSNYAAVAKKAGETVAYPGDWLYSSWSESDLKAWLDERGIPAPQPTSRDKLIASVRRNSRVASKEANKAASSLSVSAASVSASLASSGASAYQSLTDELLNSWSESQLKNWADDNGVPVPQGSKKNELVALVRKHRSRAASSVSSGYGAATSSAGNAFARATDDIYAQGKQWPDWAQYQIGIGSEEAKSSIVSAASSASSYAASVSSVAEKSASSASKVASKSGKDAAAAANSARNEVSKSAASAGKVASSSASSAAKVASSSAARAAKGASSSAASLAQIASSSLASAAKVASSSAASAAKVASSSASSAARVAASSASSAGKVAASSASSAGKVGASSASSLGRDGAKSAASLASKGADAVKSAAASVKNEL